MKRTAVEVACVVLLLAIFAVSAALQIVSTSPTYDEPVHIAAGYSYQQWGDFRLNPEHPPLLKRIAALPLRFSGVTPALQPGMLPTVGEPSFADLTNEWRAALADPGAEWTFAHAFLYGIRGSALSRLGRRSLREVEGTDSVARADFHNDADRIVTLARSMVVPFGVILGLLVYLWSRELFGASGALFSLALFVLEPSLVAHSAIVTTDVPIALCLFGSVYFFWRCLQRFSWPPAVAFVLFTAAAFVVKFTAVVLVPLLLVLALTRRRKVSLGLLASAAMVTFAVIWAAYGWRYSAASDASVAASGERAVAKERPIPHLPDRVAGHFPLQYSLRRHDADARFFEQYDRAPSEDERATAFRYSGVRGVGRLLVAIDRLHLLPEAYVYGAAFARERSVFRPSYLRGVFSDSGFSSYFLWTFLLKTPLVMTLFSAAAVIMVMMSRAHRAALRFAWIPVVVYLLLAVRANLNIGHRHLLPIYPFLFVMCGVLAWRWSRLAPRVRFVVAAAVLPLLAVSSALVLAPSGVATVWRDRLAYVNELGGGPVSGYRNLVDSNFDWGQDLPALRKWLDERKIAEPINLCYFGTADPKYYGIRHRNLFLGYDYEPDNGFDALLPGLLAISATNLIGSGYEADAREEWRRFLEATDARPVGRAGYSILIYQLSRPNAPGPK